MIDVVLIPAVCYQSRGINQDLLEYHLSHISQSNSEGNFLLYQKHVKGKGTL
jgi:hypothetical protein